MTHKAENVYVASSWRNNLQPALVHILRAAGMEVYDFKNPPNGSGFHWSEVAPGYTSGSERMEVNEYIAALEHPRSIEGYRSDFDAMQRADTFVLVLPCGRSAHLEAGWAAGRVDKKMFILLSPEESYGHGDTKQEFVIPELMYKMADGIAKNTMELLAMLGVED